MKGILLIVVSVALGAFGQLLLKKGMMGHGETSAAAIWGQLLQVATNPWIIGGSALYLVSGVLWLAVLAEFEVNFALPWQALMYVIVIIGSRVAFGESLNGWRIAGTLLICLGVIVVARGR